MSVFNPSHPMYWKTEGNYDVDMHMIIENFNNPTHTWETMNDPVMGGESNSTLVIEEGIAIFEGNVVDVPFLREPGFITMRTQDGFFPDVSSCSGLKVRAKSPEIYGGYRISFGDRHVPGNRHAYGYKADLIPAFGDEMGEVVIPFHDFTVRWSDETGEAIETCMQNPDYCPDLETLRNMRTVSIWAEGVKGKIRLEIESITAIGCDDESNASQSLVGKNYRDSEITRVVNIEEETLDDGGFISIPFLFLVGMTAFVSLFFYKKKVSDYHVISREGNRNLVEEQIAIIEESEDFEDIEDIRDLLK